MRMRILSAALLALSICGSGLETARAADIAAQRDLVNGGVVGVISGGVTGTYVRIAADLANALDDGYQLRVLPIIGKGSVRNIEDLLFSVGVALPLPNLVDDLAGLGVDRGVVLGRLQLREDPERRLRELGAEEQRLQARDQRVAPEDGHEPRHARRRELAREARIVSHSKRCEVRDGLRERVREVLPGGAELRDPQLPGGERVAHPRELLAEGPLGPDAIGRLFERIIDEARRLERRVIHGDGSRSE